RSGPGRSKAVLEQVGAILTRCAGGILWRGQEKGEGRSGTTDEPFDEPTTQKTPALRVALRRAPAVSPRSTVLPIRSSRGSWRIASPRRNAVESIWPQLALRPTPDQKLDREKLDHLVVLVLGLAFQADESPFGPRTGRDDLHHFAFDPKRVARP